MKRKVVNPNPQEKKMQKIEEKLYEHDIKEQLIRTEETLEAERLKNSQKNKNK